MFGSQPCDSEYSVKPGRPDEKIRANLGETQSGCGYSQLWGNERIPGYFQPHLWLLTYFFKRSSMIKSKVLSVKLQWDTCFCKAIVDTKGKKEHQYSIRNCPKVHCFAKWLADLIIWQYPEIYRHSETNTAYRSTEWKSPFSAIKALFRTNICHSWVHSWILFHFNHLTYFFWGMLKTGSLRKVKGYITQSTYCHVKTHSRSRHRAREKSTWMLVFISILHRQCTTHC